MTRGLDVGRAHRLALLLTIVLPTLGVMTGSPRLAGAGFALMAVAAAASPFLRRARRPRSLHVVVHALTVLLLLQSLASLKTARIDSALIIVMLGIFNRVCLRSGARDDYIIVASAAVLMTMATTITPGVAFLPLVVAFVPAVSWTLLTTTILAQGSTPREVERFAQQRLPRLRAALGLTGVLFMILGYVGVSFLPRYSFSRTFSVGAFAAFAGADRSMSLGVGGLDTRGDGSVVIRVSPPEGVSSASLRDRYMRVFALDLFDGQTWQASAPYPAPPLRESGRAPPGAEAHVTVRRLVSRGEPHPVPLLGSNGPLSVSLREPRESAGGTIYSYVPQATLRFEYDVPLRGARAALRPPQPGQFVELPETVSPRVVELARSLAGGATRFDELTRRVLGHFDRGFTYSLQPLPGDAPDPLERFLFQAKQGHCELYAGAVATMLRAVNVPARVVTGYYGGWWNASSGQLEFVGEDAHAWVEAWNPDAGWVWLDATPPDLRTARQGKPFAWARDLYDWAEALWYTYVVDYDEKRRQRILARLGEAFESGWDAVTASRPPRDGLGRGGRIGALAALAAVGLALAAWALRRRATRVARLGQRLRRALGVSEGATLGRGLAALTEPVREDARRAVRAYEALRFGRPADRPPIAEVSAHIRALEAARSRRGGKGAPC